MKQFFTFLFLIVNILPLFCQDSTDVDLSKLSEVRKYNNQLELDVRTLFNGLNKASLIYKRKIEGGEFIMVDQIKFLRIMANIQTQTNFTADPARDPNANSTIDVGLHPSNEYNFTVGIGLEKQKRSKRFVYYYGADLIGIYNKGDDDYSNGDIGGVVVNITQSTDRSILIWQTGINPFLGFKYYFTPRLNLGIETGFRLAYFNAKITEFDNKSKEFLEPVISKGIISNFNNLRFLTLGFSF